jgi:glycosyltransferase involved in cell wall biosynthesis
MLVSVVIPTFRRPDDVIGAVRSVVAQTWTDLEIVVVDDGGDDDTGERLAAEFPGRVRYEWKPNGGVSSARNRGFEVAKADYVAFLDSDDRYQPARIERGMALLQARPDLGMVVTDVERRRPDGTVVDIWRRRTQIPHDGRVLDSVMRQPALVPSSMLIRRAVYAEAGGFDESLRTAEDIDLHLKIALRAGIGVVEEPLTVITFHNVGGLSQQSRTYHEYLRVIERFVEEHGAEVDAAVRDRALLEAYARNARGLLWTGEIAESLRIGWKSVRHTRRLDDVPRVGRLAFDLAKGLAVQARRRVERALR